MGRGHRLLQAGDGARAETELVALHSLVGQWHHTPGRWKEALKGQEESARLSERCGDKQGWAAALDSIGVIWRVRGACDKTLEKHEAAVKMARESEARREEASALRNIGTFHDGEEELKYYEDALAMFRETRDRRGQAATLGSIGLA